MGQVIRLDNEQVLYVPSRDLDAVAEGNEVHFRFQGLSNDPFGSHYALFSTDFQFERQATVLGDGFQMLAQTTGTIDKPVDIGRCPDNSASYRLYGSNEPKRYYNYLVVEDSLGYTLFGFTSCRRFAGYFEVREQKGTRTLTAYIDGENTHPSDWSHSELESVVVLKGSSLSGLYETFSDCIAKHHPPRAGVDDVAPLGWCSWYAYYAQVKEQQIRDNVRCMKENIKPLEYVLIDDGYQAFMGDWLSPSAQFPSGLASLIEEIKRSGKKPAIWVAPFIAEGNSTIFRQHPDWFVTHDNGQIMKAEDVTYAGWRCTPWYLLDTTHSDVQDHLTHVFKTMREEWGIELFKLDANYWGALKGRRWQSGITGVEAYRMGMDAIAQGAGDAWLLGCNAPMWPSLGMVDAMRVSDDVERDPRRFEQIAKETFYRSWQHRKLWQIDPDCATLVSLPNQAAERQAYEFHRDVLLASGGLLLSGDPLPDLTTFAKKTLAKLVMRHNHNQDAAKFTAFNLHHGFLKLTERNDLHCLFNYHQTGREVTLTSDYPVYWFDYWSGEKLTAEPEQVIEVTLEAGLSSRAIITAPS